MKQSILILHGAIGSSVQLEPFADMLKDSFKPYLLNFSGHGGKPVPDGQFSIELFAGDVMYFISKNRLEGINVYGYSMGGYVALYIARNFPGMINKIFTTATKFDWSKESSLKESKLLDPLKISEKLPAFAVELEKRHSPEDWKIVLNKTARMMIELGKNKTLKDEDFSQIENTVLVSVGDRDKMVSIEETVDVYRKLRNGSLYILPDTPHPIEKINVERLVNEVKIFFN
ncbi:MAG: alpha/beta hydrolase [Bacteroidetes bacterium]|nr:alpha/beta hydrolase [Bacteroidota bacterium]